MVLVEDDESGESEDEARASAVVNAPGENAVGQCSGEHESRGTLGLQNSEEAADTQGKPGHASDDEEDDDPETSTSGSKLEDKGFLTNEAAGSFDCNICLELAQDPVVTLCGHLFCWPCLYKWMQLRSVCKECPVCKASVQEEKVIPLYGRGNVDSTDPRGRDIPEMDIPSRPPGQRSENQANLAWHTRRFYDPYGIGFVAGAAGPAASARFGNVTFSAGFGLFPSLFRFQFHGFPDSSGVGSMLPYASLPSSHHMRPLPPLRPDQQETLLSRLLLFVGGVMILCFLYF